MKQSELLFTSLILSVKAFITICSLRERVRVSIHTVVLKSNGRTMTFPCIHMQDLTLSRNFHSRCLSFRFPTSPGNTPIRRDALRVHGQATSFRLDRRRVQIVQQLNCAIIACLYPASALLQLPIVRHHAIFVRRIAKSPSLLARRRGLDNFLTRNAGRPQRCSHCAEFERQRRRYLASSSQSTRRSPGYLRQIGDCSG